MSLFLELVMILDSSALNLFGDLAGERSWVGNRGLTGIDCSEPHWAIRTSRPGKHRALPFEDSNRTG